MGETDYERTGGGGDSNLRFWNEGCELLFKERKKREKENEETETLQRKLLLEWNTEKARLHDELASIPFKFTGPAITLKYWTKLKDGTIIWREDQTETGYNRESKEPVIIMIGKTIQFGWYTPSKQVDNIMTTHKFTGTLVECHE